ncbi:hypothetical protein D3C84_1035920 [compost metagenome]
MEDLIMEHDEMRRKCLEHSVNYFEINEDYSTEIMKVYEFIETKKQWIEISQRS